MKNSNSKAFMVGVIALILVSVVGLGLLKVLGVPFTKPEKEIAAPPEPTTEIVSQFSQSPAWVSLNKALETPPSGWDGKGEVLTAPQAPYPFSCDTSGINPAVSVSRLFSVGGKQVQVVTTAYTAGLGFEGWKSRFDSVNSCDGGGASVTNVGGIGEETYQVDVNKSDSQTKDIVFREGDLVTYVVTSPDNSSAFNQAKTFRNHLMKSVGEKCASPAVGENDSKRNPYGGAEFTGLLKERKVQIEQFPTPTDGKIVQLNEDGTKKPESEQKAQTAKKPEKTYPLDSDPVDVQNVERPEQPTEFPVWPLLPAEMEKPVEPESPGAQPNTVKTVQEQVEDAQGPGCGWDFTGSVAPEFNAAKAKVEFNQGETDAKSELRKTSQKWQKDVLTYWDAYGTFRSNLADWNNYATQVNNVSEAWDKIRSQWATYYANKENYDNAVRDRNNFIEAKKQAADDYKTHIETCRIQDERDAQEARERAEQEREELREQQEREREREEESRDSNERQSSASPEDDSDTKRASPSPSASVGTQNDDGQRVECPASQPAILDQDPPSVPTEPTPPADPRPADARG